MRLYSWLLRLYPASFRHEYGGEMRGVFARQRQAATGLGALGLWARTLLEVPANALGVHLEVLRQDLRYSARILSRAPGFAITAVLIVALGIGATTAAFSVTDFVLIRPLPFPEPDRLVLLSEKTPGYVTMEFSPPNYRDWMQAATSFESTGAYTGRSVTMTGHGDTRRVPGTAVNVDFFKTLRVAPILGRSFQPEDDREGAPGTIILSHRFWQQEFAGSQSVLGRVVTFDNDPSVVIGVMGPDFNFPSSNVQFWTTHRFPAAFLADAQRANNFLAAIGRLRPGVTVEQAQTEMSAIAAASERQFPKENKDTGATVLPLSDEISPRSRLLLLALLGAAGCVLLIACANLANLLLARALVRRRELAVRMALGAGRERLVRQLITESLMIAGMGGVLGIGLAWIAVPLLSQLVPTSLPLAALPSVDGRILFFALALTAITGITFGLAPIMRGKGGSDLQGLREGMRAGGGARERFRSALVIAEVAASVALLVSAGLLLRALVTVRGIDPGFRAEGVLTLRTELPMPEYRTVAARDVLYARILDGVRSLPGVTHAGLTSYHPMGGFRGGIWVVAVPGDPSGDTRGANNVAAIRFATPGYFQAMGIPIKRGRDISDIDNRDRTFVAVVSESFVRRYFPNEEPLGRRFTFAGAEREVVGVVGDVRFRGLERTSEPQVYLSPKQVEDGANIFYMPKSLAVRTSGDPASLIPAVRDIFRQIEPRSPLFEVKTADDLVEGETTTRVTQARVLIAFAAIAFGLAAVGLHGLLSFAVSQRVNEIGVRVALGAQPRDILSLVLSRAALLAIAGIIPGLAIAYVAGRSMEAALAGVQPADGITIAAAITLAFLMTIAGALLPTRRALRVDPIRALRAE
jgi:putative ABC transport system permease protein